MKHHLEYFVVFACSILNVCFYHIYQKGMNEYKNKIPLRSLSKIFNRVVASVYFIIFGIFEIIPLYSTEIFKYLGITYKIDYLNSIFIGQFIFLSVMGVYVAINWKTYGNLIEEFNKIGKKMQYYYWQLTKNTNKLDC